MTQTKKKKINSISANYVTTNTAQTISAQKTFSYQSEPIHIKETRFDVSLKPSENVNNSVVTFDKNDKEVGYYQVSQESNGNNSTSIAALHYKTDGTLVRGSIRVGVNNKGETYTYAPNPANDSNNTEIATTKIVNDKISSIGSNYVTTNTAQTITGQKTFTTNSKRLVTKIKITDVDTAVTPTSDLWTNAIAVFDKNNKGMGALQFGRTAEGNSRVGIQAVKQNSDGHDVYSSIAINMNNEGVVTTSAPKPLASSNDNNIATTSWVNDKVNPIKNNYVTTNTAQDITAIKTFKTTTNHVVTKVVVTDRDNSVTPTEEKWTDVIEVREKNDTICGVLAFNQWTDGSNSAELHAATKTTSGNRTSAYIGIRSFKDGSFKTMCHSPHSNSNSNEIATTEWVNSKISTGGGSIPVGTIILSAGAIPLGYLLCNGATVSRTKYAKLFKVIGTTWGAGDGSTTFNLPDARGRFPEGANGNHGAYHAAGLPNITGYIGVEVDTGSVGGAFYKNASNVSICNGTSGVINIAQVTLSASRSSSIYKANSTVQPASFCCQYLIKY